MTKRRKKLGLALPYICAETPPAKEKAEDRLHPTTGSPSFERVRVTITEGAWKGEKGWITGPKNEVDANPITTDGGICLCWFDSEIRRENAWAVTPGEKGNAHE